MWSDVFRVLVDERRFFKTPLKEIRDQILIRLGVKFCGCILSRPTNGLDIYFKYINRNKRKYNII